MKKFFLLLGVYVLQSLIACEPTPTPTIALKSAPSPTPVPSPVPTTLPTRPRASLAPAFPFVAMMPVPTDLANAANLGAIRAQFGALRALGFNAVAQAFAANTTAYDWLAYLQIAEQENLAVIAWFNDVPPVWKDSRFELGVNEAFLRAVQTQPAFYAFLLINDPFHPRYAGMFTTERLRSLYRQAKQIAPNVRLAVSFNKTIAKAEIENNPTYAFKSGLCDICIISACEFRNVGAGNLFRREDLLVHHRIARAIVRREDTKAQLWSNAQVFGAVTRVPNDETSWYYMPKPEELAQLSDVLWLAELQQLHKLDGLMWQQWASNWQARDPVEHTLADVEFAAQREWVKQFARRLGVNPP